MDYRLLAAEGRQTRSRWHNIHAQARQRTGRRHMSAAKATRRATVPFAAVIEGRKCKANLGEPLSQAPLTVHQPTPVHYGEL